MPKLNLDELFQQKLNQLEIPHKPEYWTKMEEELETAAPVAWGIGASLSKIYTITGIATSVVVISFIAYFGFNNHSWNKKDTKMLTTSIANTQNTLVDKQSKQYEVTEEKSIAIEPIKISNSKEKSISQVNKTNRKTKPADIKNEENASLKAQVNEDLSSKIDTDNKVSSVIVADVIAINNADNFFSYEPKNILKDISNRNEGVANKAKVCNELIVIKPINKPTKNVFTKKRGILYRLGIRK